MKVYSTDRTLAVTVGAPTTGFAIEIEGHTWLFDQAGNISGNIAPEKGHKSASSPELCPGCRGFLVRDYGLPSHRKEPS